MKKIMASILLFCVLGCAQNTLSNEQIIEENKKCEAAGMRGRVLFNMSDATVSSIQCIPKDSCDK